jgi:CTD kinase subunit gamma
MNNRANIMYFIEHLCDLSVRESHLAYVQMMQRDIQHVIDAVAPPDGSGAANVKVARRVVQALQSKRLLEDPTVQELEKCLKERDTASHPTLDVEMANGSSLSRPNGVARLDKRQIEQRIEEDRERHKRLRERIWAVSGENDDEFEKMWDEASDIGEDDYLAAEEEAEERRNVAKYG